MLLCKKTLFTELLSFAQKIITGMLLMEPMLTIRVISGPGMKALNEMGIRSPLLEAGLTKKEIRELSREEGLDYLG